MGVTLGYIPGIPTETEEKTDFQISKNPEVIIVLSIWYNKLKLKKLQIKQFNLKKPTAYLQTAK